MSRSRSIWPQALFVAFVVMPLVEIYVVIQVGQVIGAWWTILLLLFAGALGAWLIKHEGGRAWRALQAKLADGGVPGKELADGALVLLGGMMLLAPGFVSDVLGLVLVLPITRPLFRALLIGYAAGRVNVMAPRGNPGAGHPDGSGPVVRGEVLDED